MQAVLLSKQNEIIDTYLTKKWNEFYKTILTGESLCHRDQRLDTWRDELRACVENVESTYMVISPVGFEPLRELSHDTRNKIAEQGIDYCRLTLRPGLQGRRKNVINTKDGKLYQITPTKKYSINLQPSIWSKKGILAALKLADKSDMLIWEFDQSIGMKIDQKLKTERRTLQLLCF